MFLKPDREGGQAEEPLLTRGLLTRVGGELRQGAECFSAQKFLEIEGPVVCFAIGPFCLWSALTCQRFINRRLVAAGLSYSW